MEVAAIRADDEVPVTKTDIAREEIEQRYHGQDVPLLLRDAPSINAYSRVGQSAAPGYSYITLRGVSPTRINFTLDGVPLADSEDMGTYFADFPDLARSLQSIQIQRGVGTSTFGSASFGGSVNMESIDLAQDEHLDATPRPAARYGNRQASVGYQSGALAGRLRVLHAAVVPRERRLPRQLRHAPAQPLLQRLEAARRRPAQADRLLRPRGTSSSRSTPTDEDTLRQRPAQQPAAARGARQLRLRPRAGAVHPRRSAATPT